MNSTKWPSLTEFAKTLGREGICRVEETDKGLTIAWIDNSPEALRRQEAIRKKDRQDKGDEEREQALIREQVRKAQLDAQKRGAEGEDENENGELKREEGEKIKLSFGSKAVVAKSASPAEATDNAAIVSNTVDADTTSSKTLTASDPSPDENLSMDAVPAPPPAKVSLKMGVSSKPKNVFAAAKKNALGGKKTVAIEQPKKISEAERIMKEEIERKRSRGMSAFGGPSSKRARF